MTKRLPGAPTGLVWLFATTLFVSSWLMFAVEPMAANESDIRLSPNDFVVPIGVGALAAMLIVWLRPDGDSTQLFVAGMAVPALVAFTQSRAPVRFAASVATMLVAGSLAANVHGQVLHVSRAFFEVYRVSLKLR